MSDTKHEPKTLPVSAPNDEAPTVVRGSSVSVGEAETWLASSAREREQVDRVEARLVAGKYKEGLAEAEPLLRQVELVGHSPLHAQVLFQLARLRNGAGDYKVSEGLSRQTLTMAARGQDLRLMSRALSYLVVTVGVQQTRPLEVAPLEQAVEAVAESTGDDLTRAIALHGRTLRARLHPGRDNGSK